MFTLTGFSVAHVSVTDWPGLIDSGVRVNFLDARGQQRRSRIGWRGTGWRSWRRLRRDRERGA